MRIAEDGGNGSKSLNPPLLQLAESSAQQRLTMYAPKNGSKLTPPMRIAEDGGNVGAGVGAGVGGGGHSPLLQTAVSDAPPGQSLPPCLFFRVFERVFVITPSPHVFEHTPSFHGPHLHGTAAGGEKCFLSNADAIVMASNSSRETSDSSVSGSSISNFFSLERSTLPCPSISTSSWPRCTFRVSRCSSPLLRVPWPLSSITICCFGDFRANL